MLPRQQGGGSLRVKVRILREIKTLVSITLKREKLMRCFPLDHLLSPTIHTLSSSNTDSRTLSTPRLNSRTGLTSTTSSGSLFRPFADRTANNLLLNPVVTCSRAIVFPLPIRVLFPLFLEWNSVAIQYLSLFLNDLEDLYQVNSFYTSFRAVQAKRPHPPLISHVPKIS